MLYRVATDTDDAGHILAHRLGGCGACPINIVPQVIDKSGIAVGIFGITALRLDHKRGTGIRHTGNGCSQ
jgi:hypothetical protein